jgi:hypothetical protein
MGLHNETFRKLVFGAAIIQQEPHTPDSATSTVPAKSAARKRAKSQESAEDTLWSDSTLSSDDKTFQPSKLGGLVTDFKEYSFDDNGSELSSIRRNGKILDIPFLEARNKNKHQTPDKASPEK